MTEPAKVRWGIIGPGTIAKAFAAAARHSATGTLVAIATRDPAKAGLADAFPGARILDGYQAILADPEVEAIYIATPHPAHAEWAIRAAEAGKHVLCEKPIAVSAAEAEAMFAAAAKAGTFLGEAFMYRHHPMTQRLIEVVRSKRIGDIRLVRDSIGFTQRNPNPRGRLMAKETAGGAILDVGCYPVSMARLIAGAAADKPFLDPAKVGGAGHLGPTGVDEWATIAMEFPNGVIADASTSIIIAQENVLRIYGTLGRIEVKGFWFASGKEGGVGEIVVYDRDDKAEIIRVDEPGWLYAFEIDDAGAAIRAGKTEFDAPGMSRADTIGNMRVLDRWRAAIGLEYDLEKPAARPRKIDGRNLTRPAKPMRTATIDGVGKPVSVLSLGMANFETYAQAEIMLDRFYEAGGNFVDTAWLYAGGKSDRLLGAWLDARGVREEMVVLGKGAHSPLTYPDVIARQLTESLDRLKTGYLDVYVMHRDNPAIPVGEFVDAMDAELKAGRIRVYGGSNWSRERMDEALAWAERHGRARPGALSNNFSLAGMIEPPWAGCLSSSDDAWKAWLRERRIPLLAWSSQAQGFFTDRAGRDRHDNLDLVRCWYNDTNFARRDRAIALGKTLGKSALQVALAYCLFQDFAVFPLIGPLTPGELDDSLKALDITLTPDQVRWLERG